MSKTLSLSLIIVSLVIGIGIGYMLTPGYSQESTHSNDIGSAGPNYDLKFINAMIAHHLGAIEMAKDAKSKSNNSDVIDLANHIIDEQEKEIELMYDLKEEWYDNTDKVKLNDFSGNVNLGSYDDKYDIRFLNAMIAHHMMAIDMAKDAQDKSTRNEILTISSNIIAFQEDEIKLMEDLRNSIR